MSQNIKVRETIHHGDYHHKREMEVYAITPATVEGIITSSAYGYLVTNSQMIPRIVEALRTEGKAELGWSTFEIV